ncbi:dihydroceramide synthase [Trypanosoma rangeli SC58]|uniref:Dihydroceramide synthase n=1 Tax=Trypanosoma rangeli SC58 TaxID=429131 RepID=A0A061IVB3_TRYRA|nr:dihydroceramide synthase [Trypanosoma rangeli SC58]
MEATSIAEGARGVPANMYAMPFSRAMEYGFVAHYNHTGDPATERHANNLSFTSEQLWWLATNPLSLQVHLNGWGGVGLDAAALPQLLPALLWAAMLVAVRFFFRREIARLGLYLQVVVPSSGPKRVDEGSGAKAARLSRGQRNKLRRFQTQVWLAVTYTASALFGYMVQRDELWFGLPLSEANRIHILSPHPYRPGRGLLLYYQYGLGFYLAECFLHLVDRDIKRSDFLEYLAHHVVTIALIVLSHCSYEHRFGVYVLFIHDVSDVMLAVSKALNYVVQAAEEREQRAARNGGRRTGPAEAPACRLYKLVFSNTTVFICFAAFAVSFFFLRLVCLPTLALASAGLAVKLRTCTVCYWVLVFLLQVVLQGLQVYWFSLIVRLAVQTIFGGPLTDIRSDDEEEDDEEKVKASPGETADGKTL